MNMMRSLLLSTAIALTGIAACNYTVGECWPVGQGGGSGTESVAAGGGVILPTGPTGGGGFGEDPPQGGTPPPLKCNSDETDETESDSSPESSKTESPCTQADAEAAFWICNDVTDGVNAGPFAAKTFKFITIVADDGDGPAGGWQEASANLRIIRLNYGIFPEIWYCPVRVGMPLRTQVNGPILPDYAATITAQVANKVAREMKKNNSDLPQGIYCITMKSEMAALFASPQYKSFGAKMMQP